jgi:phosphoesterase RecJ-like protein
MKRVDLQGVVEACRAADSFLVASHSTPDGDAIGSILAMRAFLRALGKTDITCACHDAVPRMYEWVPGAEDLVRAGRLREAYDLVIVMDVAQRERLGDVAKRIGADQRVVILDHHPEEAPFGTLNFVDPTYASCSQIVVDLYAEAGLRMSLEAATAAYVGLTTDTGSFRFGNTDARAHRHAALLLEAGVDPAEVASRVFDVISPEKLELLRRVLDRVRRSACGRVAWAHLTAADLTAARADAEDVEGLVNFVRNLEGVQVGILFRELKPGRVKVSMRARSPINAGQLLKPLGGGGHAGAAGAILLSSLDESIGQVVAQVESALGEPRKS